MWYDKYFYQVMMVLFIYYLNKLEGVCGSVVYLTATYQQLIKSLFV